MIYKLETPFRFELPLIRDEHNPNLFGAGVRLDKENRLVIEIRQTAHHYHIHVEVMLTDYETMTSWFYNGTGVKITAKGAPIVFDEIVDGVANFDIYLKPVVVEFGNLTLPLQWVDE